MINLFPDMVESREKVTHMQLKPIDLFYDINSTYNLTLVKMNVSFTADLLS